MNKLHYISLRTALALAVSAGSLSPVLAQETINAERPGFTNGAYTVTRPQYELGFTRYKDPARRDVLNDGGLLRLPAGKTLEARIGVPSRAGSEWGDGSLGVKWRVSDDDSHGIGLAINATAIQRSAPQYAFEAEHALSNLWGLQADYVHNPDRTHAGAVNLGYTVNPKVSLFAEVFSQGDGQWVDGGVTLLSGKDVQLDLNAGVGLQRGNRNKNFVGVGLARRW
ncbi:MAG: hypothetical protein QM758_03920 [Armatimonas sp.]